MTNAKIRDGQRQSEDYQKLILPPPYKGKHKLTPHQQQYEDIHAFLADRQWCGTCQETPIAGITWIELFILFDQGKYRSSNGDHAKDPKAAERAIKRQLAQSNSQGGKARKNGIKNAAIVQPTLQEELTRFKMIVRTNNKARAQR